MCRERLREIEGQAKRFVARVSREGSFDRAGKKIRTVCLERVQVTDTGKMIADHLWFLKGGGKWPSLEPGALVFFESTAAPYIRGYQGSGKAFRKGGIENDFLLEIQGIVERLRRW